MSALTSFHDEIKTILEQALGKLGLAANAALVDADRKARNPKNLQKGPDATTFFEP
jgi:hypothetical protein